MPTPATIAATKLRNRLFIALVVLAALGAVAQTAVVVLSR
jgi:hypothetical protein